MQNKNSIENKITAHLNGELNLQELEELKIWITRSKENARFYTEVKDIWETTTLDASKIAQTDKEWEKLQKNISAKKNEKKNSRNSGIRNLWRAAAIFILGALAGTSAWYFATSNQPVFISSVAPKGSISELVLPDSSLIFLNAGSFIKYDVNTTSKNREVFLEGEAWFKVAKNEKKPFVVHTPYYDVNVLGTEFNVKAYPNETKVETTLEKGSILISSSDKINLSESVRLSPGEQLIFDSEDKTVKIKDVNTRLFTSWKDNKLIFINMGLKELIVLMERKYDVNIEVRDKTILDFHYSGTIKNESIIELLDILKHTLPLKYEIDNQTIKINKK